MTQRTVYRRRGAPARPRTVAAAVEQVRASSPDVVLMDVRMPDLDGISATREVLASSPERSQSYESAS